jgi:hypothetical protein
MNQASASCCRLQRLHPALSPPGPPSRSEPACPTQQRGGIAPADKPPRPPPPAAPAGEQAPVVEAGEVTALRMTTQNTILLNALEWGDVMIVKDTVQYFGRSEAFGRDLHLPGRWGAAGPGLARVLWGVKGAPLAPPPCPCAPARAVQPCQGAVPYPP